MNIDKNLQHKIDFKTKPPQSLGQLEDIAFKIGRIQNALTPSLNNPQIIVFAGDHGLTAEKISPYPKDVTWQMVENFKNQGAAINVFCNQNNIELTVVDAGVDHDFEYDHNLMDRKVGYGTKNMIIEPAMTIDQCKEAIEKGRKLVGDKKNLGCNVIGFGEMGIGNTSSAALIMHKVCDIPIKQCVGRGTGLDDDGLSRKSEILELVAERHKLVEDPIEILSSVGGFEIAMMTGAYLEAADQNMTILVDGFISTSALLIAHALNKSILHNVIFSHQSNEQGHRRILEYLNASPILNLDLRLGEGTGIALAYPIIKSAIEFLNKMASFESAEISNKDA